MTFWHAKLRVFLFLLLASCGGKQASSQSGAEDAAAPSNTRGPFEVLAGAWQGSANITGYGTAIGTATVDAQGLGHYFVTLSGSKHQGPFTIVSWDGQYLVLEADGHQERVHASLRGESLWIDHPFIGQVRLQRSPRPEPIARP